jgi:hypothetical protein
MRTLMIASAAALAWSAISASGAELSADIDPSQLNCASKGIADALISAVNERAAKAGDKARLQTITDAKTLSQKGSFDFTCSARGTFDDGKRRGIDYQMSPSTPGNGTLDFQTRAPE